MNIIKNTLKTIPGIILIVLFSTAAFFAGEKFPLIGGPVFGIILGMAASGVILRAPVFASGIAFSARKILQLSIIILGGTLSLAQIKEGSASSLWVMLCTITGAFLTAYFLGRAMKIRSGLRNLIGVGTAICGGSAIAAIASVTKNDEHDIAYAVSTIFLFNVIAVLIFPPLGHVLGMTQDGFGLFSGTAINDTSSVLAAGYIYGDRAGEYATIVKLTRTTLIIPIAIAFALLARNHSPETGSRFHLIKIFPLFILLFIFAAAANSAGIIPQSFHNPAKSCAKFMIIMALCAIGLRTNFKKMLETGARPLLLGLAVWFTVSVISLTIQYFSGKI